MRIWVILAMMGRDVRYILSYKNKRQAEIKIDGSEVVEGGMERGGNSNHDARPVRV